VSTWECAECTTKYSVGAPKCPHCGSVVRVDERAQETEEETDMAKVTVHGGASDALAEEQEAGEDVSAGSNSSASSERESTSPEPSETRSPKRARKTASRSAKDQSGTPGSSADSADGDPAEATSETGSADE